MSKRKRQTFFAFQHFIINQELSGMKVCTDSVLFGAFINEIVFEKKIVLDIGKNFKRVQTRNWYRTFIYYDVSKNRRSSNRCNRM